MTSGQFDPVVLVFVVLPVLLLLMLAWGTAAASRRLGEPASAGQRRAALVVLAGAAWMATTWVIASSGVLKAWDRRPPPFAVMVVAIFALGFTIAFSPFGRRLATGLPLWILIASQSFRLPLELAMHGMYERGVMPVQMSYSGYNFDIVTGISAIVVAVLVKTRVGGARLAALWNIVGVALLANILGIAIASTPVFAAFGPEQLNVWVFEPPFVWLPAVMVLAALAGHLLVFRALAASHRSAAERLRMHG
jgi:hypothetical protein